jgi:hypothetical protein
VISQSLNRISHGICVRDNDGIFVLAKTMSFSPLYFVHVGEAFGLFNAIDGAGSRVGRGASAYGPCHRGPKIIFLDGTVYNNACF